MRLDPQRVIRLGVLIQHGSFGRAAAHLGVTQPALSQSIAQIEREVGVKVVERTQQGIVPTVYGQVLYEHAKAIDRELAQAARHIQDLASGREDVLNVGTTVGGAASLVALAICKLQSARPGTQTRVHEDSSIGALLTDLRNRTVDMVICHRPPEVDLKELRASPLFQTRRVACVRAGHPLTENTSIRELLRYPFVCPPDELGFLFGFPQILSTIGAEIPKIIVSDSIYVAKEIVLNSDAFALFSDVSVISERKLGLMSVIELDMPTRYWMQLIVRSRHAPSSLMKAFVGEVTAACEELHIDARDIKAWDTDAAAAPG